MKILRLQTQGFKRVVAVDVTPDAPLVQVRGDNAEGKTSLLDSIMAALGGAEAAPIKPIRTGDDFAAIRIELGDGEPAIIVEKYFDEVGEKLRVTNADGAEYRQAQTTVDNLLGRMTFDPLAFAKLKPVEQAVELRRLVPLKVDLDELARLDAADVSARRDVNRDAKVLKARFEAINVSGIIPPRPDREAIVASLTGAADTNTAIERERLRRRDVAGVIDLERGTWQQSLDRVKALRAEADQLEAAAAEKDKELTRREVERDALPPLDEPVDTAKLREDLAKADADLALLGRVDEREALEAQFETLRTRSEAFTTAIGKRAEDRAAALAEATFPVPGLGFGKVREEDDDLVVMFEGEPFAQASAAQQLRVSMALAMAANPKLRVMLIRDGSLLDAKGLALVKELAGERDYQVWLESVGEGDGTGLIMEAGSVRGAPEPEKLDGPKRRKAKLAEAEGAEQNATDGAAEDRSLKVGGEVVGEITSFTTDAAQPPRRKPAAMREFTTPKPGGGGGLFGDDE